jgi:hypothetical protein
MLNLFINALLLLIIIAVLYGIYRIRPVKRRTKVFYFRHKTLLVQIAVAIFGALVISYIIVSKI